MRRALDTVRTAVAVMAVFTATVSMLLLLLTGSYTVLACGDQSRMQGGLPSCPDDNHD